MRRRSRSRTGSFGSLPLTRRRVLQGMLGSAVWSWACDWPEGRQGAARMEAPSFLILVTDDQRADTLGCMGNPVIQTPAIDALGAEGLIFDQAFVTTSACPSSRASILTGQYMRRHGIRGFSKALSARALRDTYPLLLQAGGYRTGFFGKWGIGGSLPSTAFDSFGGFAGQGHYYESEDPEKRHLTDVLASNAIEFLEQDDGRPFCLSLSFKAPHGPWYFDPKLIGLYDDRDVPIGATATLDAVRNMDEFLRGSMVGNRGYDWLADRRVLQDRIKAYYRMITGVDRAVARLVEALERLALRDRVVILFTSDNGLLVGEHGFVGKALMQEESIRVPFILSGAIPVESRGRRPQEMVLNLDVAPTILDLAGLPIPDGVQGRSLAPLMAGPADAWREDWFYEFDMEVGYGYFPTLEGVRTSRWKYVHYLDPGAEREELYDVDQDPLETRDLVALGEHPEVLVRLRQRWEHYRATLA